MKVLKKIFNKNLMFYLKILAMVLIPSLYTVTYLASNADPYSSLGNVPVGIVNLDKGYTVEGEEVNIGDEIASEMIETKGFAFEMVEKEDFSYDDYFMEIEIDQDLSRKIVDFQNHDFEQPFITVKIDESQNYIFASIAQESLVKMQSDTNDEIVKNYLTYGLEAADVNVELLNDYKNNLKAYVEETNEKLDKIQTDINSKFNEADANINSEIDKLKTVKQEIIAKFKVLETNFDQVKKEVNDKIPGGRVNTVLKDLDENYKQANAKLEQFDQEFELPVTQDEIKKEWETINDQIDSYQEQVLNAEFFNKQFSFDYNFDKVVTFFAEPVIFKAESSNPVKNYGEGLAPFFISLSLFVGGLLLMTVLDLKELKKTFNKITTLKVIAFYALIPVLQVLVLYFLLININDVAFINPQFFIFYSILIGEMFLFLILLLTVGLGDIGKFIGFVLLIMQLGGSGGTFPIEAVPKFFQTINPFLPMTYTIQMYRKILFKDTFVYGGHFLSVAIIVVILIVFVYLLIKKKLKNKE